MQRSPIDTSRSSRSARPWAKEGRPANLQGPGLDPARGPEEEGIPGHAAAAVVGDPGQLPTAGPGRCLLVDTDHSRLAGPALVL